MLLLHTDNIQENFYDVFNRRFRCVYIKDENRFYANISCGAHSKMSRIHPKFTCTIVMRESELKHTPSPFLNRFEKYYLSFDDLLHTALQLLPPTLRPILKAVHSKVRTLLSLLCKRSLACQPLLYYTQTEGQKVWSMPIGPMSPLPA